MEEEPMSAHRKLVFARVNRRYIQCVVLAGIIPIILLGALASTWYWVIPRDDVEIDILYLQRNGHVVLAELTNDVVEKSDVTLTIDFVDQENTVLDS